MNLPALAEADLRQTIEGDFGIPVTLIPADTGIPIDKTVDGRPLTGKVRWSQPEVTEEGQTVVVPAPVVTLRRSSLPRTPKTGENWVIVIPSGPRPGSPLEHFSLDPAYAVEGGKSLGKVRLPLVKLEDAGGEHESD
jgi:hypothetical protein